MSLSADELASLRATLNTSLSDSGTIYRYGTANSGYGQNVGTVSPIGTAACRVAQQGSPFEQEIAGRLGSDTLWTITFPAGTDVDRKDKVQTEGRTFEVQGVNARSNEISRRVTATEPL